MADPVVTPHTDTPAQAAQAAEAREMGATRIPAGETAVAFEGAGDGSPQDPGGPQGTPTEPQRQAPQVRSPSDEARAAITARFRTDRQAIIEQNTDQITDFSATHIPEDFRQAAGEIGQPVPLPEPEPQQQPQQQAPLETPPPDQKYKIKVRGEEREVTIEELKAIAQKNEAADQYLEEAKNKLHEVNTLLAQTRQQAQQPAQPGHQAGQPGPQPQPAPQQPAPGEEHPDAISKLLEAIQFGDNPEAARQLLQDTIAGMTNEVATRKVQEQLLQQRLKDEGARSAKVIADFTEKHPELANDDKARAAIEVTTLRIQREDLRSLGLDPDHLRTDGHPTTPGDVSQAHRYYRTEGHRLHTPAEMLETAIKEVNDWRGIKPENPAPTPTNEPPKGAPRIEVSRERQDRLRAVPQQPSRTTAPTLQSPPPVDQTERRSNIVEQMKARTKGTPRRGGASVPA